ncbi:MAG: hypothetical protein IPM85_08535 [Chitinophagaceae bacterium]|nr:hypothetical protein [Chitinophagaceae bacterium]
MEKIKLSYWYGVMMNAYATILVYDRHTAKEYKEDEQIKHYSEIKRLKSRVNCKSSC